LGDDPGGAVVLVVIPGMPAMAGVRLAVSTPIGVTVVVAFAEEPKETRKQGDWLG
jgi:hypothetical protein